MSELKFLSCQCLYGRSSWCLLEEFPSVFCQSFRRVHLMSSLTSPISSFPMSVCLFLPMFNMGNLLMFSWTELACLLAGVSLVSSTNVLSDVFQGHLQCLFSQRLSDGFDQCLFWLVLFCLFLPLFIVRNLLMSFWTELACLLADVLLVSSINVLPEVFPNVFCQSV